MGWITTPRPWRIGAALTLVGLVGVSIATPYAAAAQAGPTQPPAAECAEEIESVQTGNPVAGDSAAVDQDAASERAALEHDPRWDPTEGRPAGVEDETAITYAVEVLLACSNAGDPGRVYGLATPDFRARRPVSAALPGPVPAAEDERIGIVWYEAIRLLDDGSATAFVWIIDPTFSDEDLVLGFAMVPDERGRWLLDDLVLMDDPSPVAYDLPAVRPVRDAAPDTPDATPAATPTGSAERKVTPPNGEEPFLPAETSAAAVRADFQEDGRAVLANTVVTGVLDLRRTRTDTFVATNVRFAGGIVAGLIESARSPAPASEPIEVHFFFENVVFSGPVDLRWGRLNLECDGCIFEDVAILHSVSADVLTFERSLFQDDAVFVNLDVATLFNVRETRFRGAVDFTGADLPAEGIEIVLTDMTTREPIQIAWSQFGDRWLAAVVRYAVTMDETASGISKDARLRQIDADLRFWRQNFADIGRDRDARTVYRELVAFQQEHLMDRMGGEWWEASLKGLGSAYGTAPYRPLWASAVVVLAFGLVYWLAGSFAEVKNGEVTQRRQKPKLILRGTPATVGRSLGPKNLAFALAYSVDTFVPFTVVTGVKDWGWQVTGWTRWAVAAERALGAGFAALIVYNVGSYVI